MQSEPKQPSRWTGSPPLHHNILIIYAYGEWFDRYSELPPIARPPDTVIRKCEHREYSPALIDYGEFKVWRDSNVPQKEWDKALDALTGVTTYEGKKLPEGMPIISHADNVEKHQRRSSFFKNSPRKAYVEDDWDV